MNDRRYFCQKRQIEIINLEMCEECYNKKQSGFTDKRMCQEFNLCLMEDKKIGNC